MERRRINRLAVRRREDCAELWSRPRAIKQVAIAIEAGLDQAAVASEEEALVIQAEAQRQRPIRWPARPQAEELNGHAEAPRVVSAARLKSSGAYVSEGRSQISDT